MSYWNIADVRKGLKFQNPGFLNVLNFLKNVRQRQPITVFILCKEMDMPLERVHIYLDFLIAYDLIALPTGGNNPERDNRYLKLSNRGEKILGLFKNPPSHLRLVRFDPQLTPPTRHDIE